MVDKSDENKLNIFKNTQSSLVLNWAGLEVTGMSNGHCTIELDIQEHHRGGGGTTAVNGGILAYMVDVMLGMAVYSAYDPTKHQGQVTIHLNIDYLNMLQGNKAIGKADVVRTGGTISYAEGGIYDETGNLCVRASGTLRVYLHKN